MAKGRLSRTFKEDKSYPDEVEGTKYRIVHNDSVLGYIDTIVILHRNDGTTCPAFVTEDGSDDNYEYWKYLEPYKMKNIIGGELINMTALDDSNKGDK